MNIVLSGRKIRAKNLMTIFLTLQKRNSKKSFKVRRTIRYKGTSKFDSIPKYLQKKLSDVLASQKRNVH